MDKLLFMLLVGIICTSYSLSSENVTVVEEPGSTNGTNITEVNNGTLGLHAAFVPNISAFQQVVPADIEDVQPREILVKAGIVLTRGTSNPYDHDLLQPALDVAFARARQVYNVRFEVHEFLYEVASSSTLSPDANLVKTQGCWMWNATGKAAEAFNASMDVIIGPACTDDMRAANELLTYFAVPSVTGAGNLVDSTANYPFLTRCSFSSTDIWLFLLDFIHRHAWINIILIYDSHSNDVVTEAQSLMRLSKERNLLVYDTEINATLFNDFDSVPSILKDASHNGRVFIILLRGKLLRYVLTTAYRIGLCDGEHVFITLDLFHEDLEVLGSGANWQQRDGYDSEAKKAYSHLLVVSLKNTSSSAAHQQFVKDVHSAVDHRRRYNDPLPVVYPVVNYYMGAFRDAVVMLGRAFRQAIDGGAEMWPRTYKYRSGKVTDSIKGLAINITQRLHNVTFQGVSGEIFLDINGDRLQDMTIYYMLDTNNGIFSPVAEFNGALRQYRQVKPIPWRSRYGQAPLNEPVCGYNNDKCTDVVTVPTVISVLVALLLLAGLIAGFIFYRKARREARLAKSGWVIEWEDLQLDKRWQGGSRVSMQSTESSRQTLSVQSLQESAGQSTDTRSTRKGRQGKPPPSNEQLLFGSWKGIPVMLRLCEKGRVVEEWNDVVIEEMRIVRALTNDNLLKVYGAVLEPLRLAIVNEYCSKGTLQDVLLGGTTKLEWLFRFSLINDMVNGISYLHGTVLTFHGRLSSACCYVNGKFVLKVGDYGLPSFYARTKSSAEATNEEMKAQYHTAPEILQYPSQKGSQEADVYAFAIILQEIILREEAYSMYSFDPKEILWRVRKTSDFRPTIDAKEHPECPQGLLALMEQCWAKDPLERPRFPQIKSSLRLVTKGDVDKSNIVDLLIQRMETYATDLEGVAQEKTRAFLEEQKKTDELLNQILPPMVAEKLKQGQTVPPEVFKSTTIFFSDIVGFAALSMESSPIEIVNFLNDLYSLFDATIPKFDVYKVETIHDSYMVASGLPTRNGLNHAREQGNLALTLMELILTFKIRHRPNEVAQLRIGMNSGSCVASVIGLAVPRYCLFGDTVNTASRMESTGEGLRIQVSPSTKQLLDSFGTFHMEERGLIAVKGKGQVRTYWLVSGEINKDESLI